MKCQVRGCENKAKYFTCQHEDGDHEICQECVDKYFKPMIYRYVINRGWQKVPGHTPTVPHTTEHGDVIQVVEEKEMTI